MEIKVVDFTEIHQIIESNKLNINSFEITKHSPRSYLSQLNSTTNYIYLHGEHSFAKILFNNEQCFLQASKNIIARVGEWQKTGIIPNSYNLISLIGFEFLEKIQAHIEEFELKIENIEEQIMVEPDIKYQKEILKLHRKAIHLKKWIHEYLLVFNRLGQNSPCWTELIQEMQYEMDNARQIIELLENCREAYQASVDNKLNDVMKFLTVLATILLPVNLLTSFWGMNFQKNMPLLDSSYGIFVFFALSFIIVFGFITYLRKKKWV